MISYPQYIFSDHSHRCLNMLWMHLIPTHAPMVDVLACGFYPLRGVRLVSLGCAAVTFVNSVPMLACFSAAFLWLLMPFVAWSNLWCRHLPARKAQCKACQVLPAFWQSAFGSYVVFKQLAACNNACTFISACLRSLCRALACIRVG